MKRKTLFVAVLVSALLFALTACDTAQLPTASDDVAYTTEQTEKQSDVKSSGAEASTTRVEKVSVTEDTSTDAELTTKNVVSTTNAEKKSDKEAWKTAFEADLLQKYGAVPEYYEDLGNGIYQVYVKIDGKVVPFVAVNSATGDYHG